MRTIVCGAGQVGYNIASYLAREKNDVTVIDIKPELIAKVNDELDANGIVGHGSNPDILRQAGADEADMIIAVTHYDEVNMVACQIAHSLFNIPKKVARLRQSAYLDPAWSNLFSRAHMPIDVIISPEREVALDIMQRLKIPGTMSALPLLEGKAFCISVMVEPNCPIINTELGQLRTLFPEIDATIVLITRNGQPVLPHPNVQLYPYDEVTIVTSTEHLKRTLSALGHEEKAADSILIIGGGNIGQQLSLMLRQQFPAINLKIIEHNYQKAKVLSGMLPDATIFHGDALDKAILEEAGVEHAQTLVAVTNDDEANILTAILAKQYGCERTITLVNKEIYNSLVSVFKINSIVSPRMITAATIMKHVRRGRINAVYDIKEGYAELIEASASDVCRIVNTPLNKMHLPPGIKVVMIKRGGNIFLPTGETTIEANDIVVIFATQSESKNVEKLFSFKFDLI